MDDIGPETDRNIIGRGQQPSCSRETSSTRSERNLGSGPVDILLSNVQARQLVPGVGGNRAQGEFGVAWNRTTGQVEFQA